MEIYEFKATPLYNIFYNESNGFGIYNISTLQELPNAIYNNTIEKYCTTILGNVGELSIGCPYQIKATMQYNEKYDSHQYQVQSISILEPQGKEENEVFIKSVITEKQAQTLLTAYPNIIEELLKDNNFQIDYKKTKGIKEKTYTKIKKKIIDSFGNKELISLLSPYDISITTINNIAKDYTSSALATEKIKENPYILTKIKGIGFKRADAIALSINLNLKNSRFRAEAYIKYLLNDIAMSSGDTYLTFEQFIKKNYDNIPECKTHIFDILKEQPEWIYVNKTNDAIGLQKYYNMEKYVFTKLLDLQNNTHHWTSDNKLDLNDIKDEIKQIETSQGFEFTDEQLAGIQTIIKNQITCVIGNAGTGKSTVSNGFLKIFDKRNKSILQCCLSGKASLRLKEINGFEAKTIHKVFLSCQLSGTNIKEDILVIDEASMIGLDVFKSLLEVVTPKTKIIIMGDTGQLDAIGAGNIFKDILNSGQFPVIELTKIHRQAQKSAIITDSIKIRKKYNIVDKDFIGTEVHGELQDLQIRTYTNNEETLNHVMNDYLSHYKEVGIENIQAVLPMNTRGSANIYDVNNQIQNEVNPPSKNKNEITIKMDKLHSYIIREGDKVMNIVNNYKVEPNIFNGNIGIVQQITKDEMVIDFTGVGIVKLDKEFWNNIILAYASTCHKLQGSEFDIVVIGIDTSAYMLLTNQWLYTAITRAKKKCYLSCQNQALSLAISKFLNKKKNTFLGNKKIIQEFIHSNANN